MKKWAEPDDGRVPPDHVRGPALLRVRAIVDREPARALALARAAREALRDPAGAFDVASIDAWTAAHENAAHENAAR
jgi:hypothetical protein